ncbi:T9SS type A sorting domain-containing protein [uncultured Lacinutrix sp.]|uniref:T9SS type A sorting domain-containing protein n=1 Tax=uncultured Lacinutrix sp. TaxID=574032 RepID=UPI0026137740|nr:T9SS type A sorting domain-containing protein [uncultured Lacinutrix sp.]
MKTKLVLLALVLSYALQAQTYQLTLIQNSAYNYSVAAIPDFNSTAPHPYINDQNFTITIPDGVTVSGVSGGYAVPIFTDIDAFNPGEDAIAFNLVQDIVLPEHTIGTPIVLTTFSVDGSPTSGAISLLDNTSGLVMAAPSIFSSFFIGTLSGDLIDSATNNYAGQTGTISYSFSTLSTTSEELTGVSIYPNPTKRLVTIKGIDNLQLVEVFNNAGQRVLGNSSNLNIIDLSKLPSGLYMAKLYSNTGESKIVKLVKE